MLSLLLEKHKFLDDNECSICCLFGYRKDRGCFEHPVEDGEMGELSAFTGGS